MSDDNGKRDACLLLDRSLHSLGILEELNLAGLKLGWRPRRGASLRFREPGWLPTCEVGHFALVRHQGVASWRGIAVAINTRKFVILKKKACDHAVWVQLQDKSSTRKLWVRSLYLSTGIPLDEYQSQFRRALELLPANADIALAIGDLNVAMGMLCRRLMVWWSWVSTGPRVTLEVLLERARKGFHARHQMFHSNSSIAHRVRFLDCVVFGSIAWVIGALHLSAAGLKSQLKFIISMMGWRRGEGEAFVDFRQRAFRGARQLLFSLAGSGGLQLNCV